MYFQEKFVNEVYQFESTVTKHSLANGGSCMSKQEEYGSPWHFDSFLSPRSSAMHFDTFLWQKYELTGSELDTLLHFPLT